ncbi:MAG: hypothetical protein AB7I01_22525 [Gammaproteobacteria bacterium]
MTDGIDPYAPPAAELDLRQQVGEVARDGKHVRMERNGQLPHRCVICNATALPARVNRTLYWTPWQWRVFAWGLAIALFVLMSQGSGFAVILFWPAVLVIIVVHMLIRKRVRLELGICARHQRWRNILFWLAVGSAAMSILAAVVMLAARENLFGEATLMLIPLMFALAFANGLGPANMVRVAKVSAQHLWLARTGKAFRDSLPDVPS